MFYNASAPARTNIEERIEAASAELEALEAKRQAAYNRADPSAWVDTRNPLMAPLYHRRHKNQPVVDRFAEATPISREEAMLDITSVRRPQQLDPARVQSHGEPAYQHIPPELAGGYIYDYVAREVAAARSELANPRTQGAGLARLSSLVAFGQNAPDSVIKYAPDAWSALADGWTALTTADEPRTVKDPNFDQPGSAYTYQQDTDGTITILTDGMGNKLKTPDVVKPDDPRNAAMTGVLGSHPATDGLGGLTAQLQTVQDEAALAAKAGDLHYGSVIDAEIREGMELGGRDAIQSFQNLARFAEATPDAIGGSLSLGVRRSVSERLAQGDGGGLARDLSLLAGAGQRAATTESISRERYSTFQDEREAERIEQGHPMTSPDGSRDTFIDSAADDVYTNRGEPEATHRVNYDAPPEEAGYTGRGQTEDLGVDVTPESMNRWQDSQHMSRDASGEVPTSAAGIDDLTLEGVEQTEVGAVPGRTSYDHSWMDERPTGTDDMGFYQGSGSPLGPETADAYMERRKAGGLMDQAAAAAEAGDHAQAAELYRQANSVIPHPAARFNMAYALEQAGMIEEARREYERIVATTPELLDQARERLRAIAIAHGASPKEQMQQAPSALPDVGFEDPTVYYQRNRENSRVVKDPNFDQPGSAYTYLQMADGTIQILTDGMGNLLDKPETVTAEDPRHGPMTASIGSFPTHTPERPPNVPAESASSPERLAQYASRAAASGDYQTALEAYTALHRQQPTAGSLMMVARALLALGRSQDARQVLAQVVASHPGTSEAREADTRMAALDQDLMMEAAAGM
jgi:tetratricopeptide (TPR) repeat protein